MSELTEDALYGVALAMVVGKALDGTGFVADQDPARGGSKVHIIDGGDVLSVAVPVVDEANPDAVLDVSIDRASLCEAVEAVARVSGLRSDGAG
jgi:hypothetical protein